MTRRPVDIVGWASVKLAIGWLCLIGAISIGGVAGSSGSAANDEAAPPLLRNLRGCFQVSYRFVEDGTHDYEIKDALEWITLKESSGAHVVTHYGVVGNRVAEHFSEYWTRMAGDRWRQQVGSPTEPRYTCEAELRFGQVRCTSRGAAKPLRDDKRTDYDVLNRLSTIQVTPAGWVQNEVNDKVTKAGKVVATEVGWIEYRRTTDETSCASAKATHP
jgi:hypothetical protein